MKISEILAKYDTDKVSGHCYGDSYDELFSSFDRTDPLNILEIGSQKGGSLCAWKEFFPNSKVTGVDIIDVIKPEYKMEGIRHVVSDIKEWKTDERFDIIIDDGSHFLSDVMYVVKEFLPKLDGIMVIEDVQDPNAWMWNLRQLASGSDFSAIDLRGVNGNYDDFLIVIKK